MRADVRFSVVFWILLLHLLDEKFEQCDEMANNLDWT